MKTPDPTGGTGGPVSDLIVPDEARIAPGKIEDPDRVARKHGWGLVGWAGMLVVVTGGIDLLTQFFPVQLSDGKWRFAVATGLASGLLVPSLGLALVLASMVAFRRHHATRAISLVFGALAALVAASGYYVLSVSPAVLDATPAAGLAAMQQIITGATVSAIVHTVAFALMASAGWKYT
jgi:hypothetical protein